MTMTLAILLLTVLGINADEPPEITGTWVSDEWGNVKLSQAEAGKYHGEFPGDSAPGAGSFEIEWSESERRYNGNWSTDANHAGKISLRLIGAALHGASTSNKKSRKDSGTPALADFTWTPAGIAADATEPWASGMSAAEVKWRSQTTGVQIGFGGKSVDHWLETFWNSCVTETTADDAPLTAIKAFRAIQYFRDQPQYDDSIRSAMAKWYSTTEQEQNPAQLQKVARAIASIAGPRHQRHAVDYLFQIAARHPDASVEKFFQSYSRMDSIMIEPFALLELDTDLASRASKLLAEGTTSERLMTLLLFFEFERGANDISFWVQRNDTKLIPALLKASNDQNETVRMRAVNVCGSLMDSKIASRLIDMSRSDPSASNRGFALQLLLHHQQITQEVLASVASAIESDAAFSVRAQALGHLTLKQPNNDLIHHTLLKWARSGDTETMQTAIMHLQYHPPTVRREQGIDELIQLLADPEWGLNATLNLHTDIGKFDCIRQFAISTLGSYQGHAARGLPILKAESDPKTVEFAQNAIDQVSGYCADLPVDAIQGKWQLIGGAFPDHKPSFLPLDADADHDAGKVMEIVGTQLLIADKCVGHVSKARGTSEEIRGVVLNPESHERRFTVAVEFHGNSDRPKHNGFSLHLIEKSIKFGLDDREEVYEFRKLKNND